MNEEGVFDENGGVDDSRGGGGGGSNGDGSSEYMDVRVYSKTMLQMVVFNLVKQKKKCCHRLCAFRIQK